MDPKDPRVPWREPTRPAHPKQVEAEANSAGWGRGQQGEFSQVEVGWLKPSLIYGIQFVKFVVR